MIDTRTLGSLGGICPNGEGEDMRAAVEALAAAMLRDPEIADAVGDGRGGRPVADGCAVAAGQLLFEALSCHWDGLAGEVAEASVSPAGYLELAEPVCDGGTYTMRDIEHVAQEAGVDASALRRRLDESGVLEAAACEFNARVGSSMRAAAADLACERDYRRKSTISR